MVRCEDMFLSMCNCIISIQLWLARKITGRHPLQSENSNSCDVEANQQRRQVIETNMERDEQKQHIDKLDDELRKVKTERDRLNVHLMSVKVEDANLKKNLSDMEKEKNKMEKEKFDAFTELRKVAADRDEHLRRLSEIMSSQLRDNNPNIADLDDPNRPTKLADVFSEIYDNEWTGAFEVLEDSRGEPGSIALLLDVVMEAHVFCVGLIVKQWEVVQKSILWNLDGARSVETLKWLKDARKSHALTMLPKIQEDFEQTLKAMSLFSEDEFAKDDIQEYVGSCIRLCWLMSVQDPPVVFGCPGWSSRSSGIQVNQGQGQEPKAQSSDATPTPLNFNHDLFREYTSKGNVIEFVVWPVMYLCKDGPILKKGVAQGCKRV